jgi:O-acetyl-ADP-ribose deacetylase (regulator of RNase III)
MPLHGTINAYLATRAALGEVYNIHEQALASGIAFPGMGTGVGELDPRIAAYQMVEAIRDGARGNVMLLGPGKKPTTDTMS